MCRDAGDPTLDATPRRLTGSVCCVLPQIRLDTADGRVQVVEHVSLTDQIQQAGRSAELEDWLVHVGQVHLHAPVAQPGDQALEHVGTRDVEVILD